MEKEQSAKLELNFALDGDLFRVCITETSIHVTWFAPHMKLEDTNDLSRLPEEARLHIEEKAREFDFSLFNIIN